MMSKILILVLDQLPPHPPPLPEPPPFINGCDYRIHRWLHSSTSTDGEKKFLFRSMYQVHDDDDDDTATTNIATTDTATTTVRRPLSSTVPGSAFDGELILCRLTYRVVILQPFHLSTTAPATAPVTAHDNNDDDTIAISQLVIYQDKYVLPSDNRYRYSTTPTDGELILLSGYEYSVTSTDGEKLIFRSMY
jgi:hypothetical protein